MLYTDGVHLVADTLIELHLFAVNNNVNKCWFDAARKHPHYDMISVANKITLRRGVSSGKIKQVESRIILLISKSLLRATK